jgi:hypothetical protein
MKSFLIRMSVQVRVTGIFNGETRTAVRLYAGNEPVSIGESLSLEEQEFLAGAINRYLEGSGRLVAMENDLTVPGGVPMGADSEESFNRLRLQGKDVGFGRQRPFRGDSWDD